MSNGKTHFNFIKLTIPLLIIILILLSKKFNFKHPIFFISLIIIFYYLGGYFFSPDLDIKSKPYNNWKYLKFIWYPYQKLIPHRSILSHGIFIGTTIRLLYLYLIFSIIYSITFNVSLNYIIINTFHFVYEKFYIFFPIFLGLELSSLNHIFLDKFSHKK